MYKFGLLLLILSLSILPASAGDQRPAASLGSLRLDMNVQESPQVTSEWNTWGSRLNELIDSRFESLAKAKFKSSPALTAEVLFSVTKDGRISGAELSKKSDNIFFNMMTLDAIKSLAGDSRLAFPQGSNKLVMSGHKVFDMKAGSDFSQGKQVSAEPSPARCCSGASVFASQNQIQQFLDGKGDTLCGYDQEPGQQLRLIPAEAPKEIPPYYQFDENKQFLNAPIDRGY